MPVGGGGVVPPSEPSSGRWIPGGGLVDPRGVGSGDLYPFPDAVIQPFPLPSRGTGSLVGPGHPMFDPPGGMGGGGRIGSGGLGGGAIGPGGIFIPGLPQPRFDPYGPVGTY